MSAGEGNMVAGPGEGSSAAPAPPAREPDEAMVDVVAYWVDDNESWWILDDDETGAEGNPERFHGRIPASAREAQKAAWSTWEGATEHIVTLLGLEVDQPCKVKVCAEWVGKPAHPIPYCRIQLGEDSPAPGLYVEGAESTDAAAARIAKYPERFFIAAFGRLVEVHRSQLVVDAGEWAAHDAPCDRCGWERGEHAPVERES